MSHNQTIQEDVCGLNISWMNSLFLCESMCVTVLFNLSPDRRWTASQRVQEVRESFVPGVGVVQVTGVTRSCHHHHAVIGQVTQVSERNLSELSVLVTVNYERWDLEEALDTHTEISMRCDRVQIVSIWTKSSDPNICSCIKVLYLYVTILTQYNCYIR